LHKNLINYSKLLPALLVFGGGGGGVFTLEGDCCCGRGSLFDIIHYFGFGGGGVVTLDGVSR